MSAVKKTREQLLADGKYTPIFIESYFENRIRGQTIDEWTHEEGVYLHEQGEIYLPTQVAVSIQGSCANLFAVDTTRANWQAKFTDAVKSVLVEGNLASPSDSVRLVTVRGDAVDTDMTLHKLRAVGNLYPEVAGVRLTPVVPAAVIQNAAIGGAVGATRRGALAAVQQKLPERAVAAIGTQLRTPATYAINKEDHLNAWCSDMCESVVELLVPIAARATSLGELDSQLLNSDKVQQLLQKHVEEYAASHVESFSKLIETHADPIVLDYLDTEHMTVADVASAISEHLMETLAGGYEAKGDQVVAFFQNQEAKRTMMAAANATSASTVGTGRRAVFSIGSSLNPTPVNETVVDMAYPNALALHRTMLSAIFHDNQFLNDTVTNTLVGGPCKFHARRRRNKNKGGRRGRSRSASREIEKMDAEISAAIEEERPLRIREIGAGMADHQELFDHKPEAFIAALDRRFALARLPPAPAVEPIGGAVHRRNTRGGKSVVHNKSEEEKKFDDDADAAAKRNLILPTKRQGPAAAASPQERSDERARARFAAVSSEIAASMTMAPPPLEPRSPNVRPTAVELRTDMVKPPASSSVGSRPLPALAPIAAALLPAKPVVAARSAPPPLYNARAHQREIQVDSNGLPSLDAI